MKTIGITGGTGLVGKHLATLLLSKGYEVIIFTRGSSIKAAPQGLTYAHWDESRKECDIAALKRSSAIVHLAGAGVADKRWTQKRKDEIEGSRVKGTAFLVSLLQEHATDCKTLVAASAIGYYGPHTPGSAPFTETSPPCNDFLGTTCQHWEESSQKASVFARTVILRFGIVLGKESGAFPEFAKPLSLRIMPILGTGNQVISWIEADDLACLIVFALEKENFAGTYNAVTPQPVTQRDLMKTIATVKGGFHVPVPVPALALKMLLGELSTEVLKSCAVSSEKVTKAGFVFKHPDIESGVKAIMS